MFEEMKKPLLDFVKEQLGDAEGIEEIEIGPENEPGLRVCVDDWKFDIHISQVDLIS